MHFHASLVLISLFFPNQRAVTIGMYNSYIGALEHVKNLLEMGLVSIDDKDAVSACCDADISFARVARTHCPAHFNLTRQNGRTMLDYAIISKSNGNNWNRLDETVVFLQSCSRLSEFNAPVVTRSHHVQTS
jgi:hypothetical protein